MRYYKIIKDGMVVDANFVFLKWTQNGAGMRFLETCDIEEAQYIQSYDQKEIYRVRWLNPVEDGGEFPTVEATLIDEAEYNEIREQLDGGEPIPDPDPEPDPEPSPDPDPEPDPEPDPAEVMTVEVMRRKIIELEEKNLKKDEHIEFLEDCLMEMANEVYK